MAQIGPLTMTPNAGRIIAYMCQGRCLPSSLTVSAASTAYLDYAVQGFSIVGSTPSSDGTALMISLQTDNTITTPFVDVKVHIVGSDNFTSTTNTMTIRIDPNHGKAR
jgi:hypothetical protein